MRKPGIISLPTDDKSLKYRDFLHKVSAVLKNGGVVVAPTDTVYGLLAHAQKKKAIPRIQNIKGRNIKKSMPVLVGNFKQAERFGKFSLKSKKLVRKLWPGPYTVVVNGRERMLLGAISPDGSIGLRIPKNKWLQDLIKITGAPLVATSANPAAKKAAKTAGQAAKYFLNAHHKPDLFVDAGLISKRPSIIIDCRVWPPIILRGRINVKLKAQTKPKKQQPRKQTPDKSQ